MSLNKTIDVQCESVTIGSSKDCIDATLYECDISSIVAQVDPVDILCFISDSDLIEYMERSGYEFKREYLTK